MTQILNQTATFAGPGFMIAAGILFAGSNTAVQMAGMQFNIPSSTTAFWQYAIATLFALPLLLRSAWRTNRIGLHIVRVVLAVIGVQAWAAGLAYVPIWQAIALILLSPIFVSLGAAVFLGEKLTRDRFLAVFIGALGGVIILAPWTDDFALAAFLPVLAAFFWAGSSLITKVLTKTESTQVLTVYLLALLVPFNAIAAIGQPIWLSPDMIQIILIAGVLTAAAQFCLARAYALSDASYLQPFDHFKLPANVLLGFVVFGFAPPGAMWIGAAIIVAASAWLMKNEA